MASQSRFGSQKSSSPFGGFSTLSQRLSTQQTVRGIAIPSQPHYKVIGIVSPRTAEEPRPGPQPGSQLYNSDAALLAPGTSDMGSIVTSATPAASPAPLLQAVSTTSVLSPSQAISVSSSPASSQQLISPSQDVSGGGSQLTQEQRERMNRNYHIAIGRQRAAASLVSVF